jgi:hypothetical protein
MLYPFTMLMSSPWKKSPNVRPRTKNKAWFFVNSFSFNFLEFLVKIYWANFFPWAMEAKKGWCVKNRTDPAPEAGWAGQPGPTGPVGFRRPMSPIFARIAPFRLPSWVKKF